MTTPAGTMPVVVARPATAGAHPAVVLCMEAVGLNAHIRSVARRLAAEGFVVLVPDYYWRGGTGRVASYDELPKAFAMMGELYGKDGGRRGDWLEADLGAALDWLAARPFARADRIGVTGFCLGGRVTLDVASAFPDRIAAAAPFYGAGIPFDALPRIRCPVLGFYGGRDALIPVADVGRMRDVLRAEGVDAEVVVYPEAGHGFFCDDRPASYSRPAAEAAWPRLVAFLRRHLDA